MDGKIKPTAPSNPWELIVILSFQKNPNISHGGAGAFTNLNISNQGAETDAGAQLAEM